MNSAVFSAVCGAVSILAAAHPFRTGMSKLDAPDAPAPGVQSAPIAAPVPAIAPGTYAPVRRADGRLVVALDIGHTISQPGAISASGRTEFEFNRRIVTMLEARLRSGRKVDSVVINPDGRPIALWERTRWAALAGAALFVAVHHDSTADKYLQPQVIGGRSLFYCDRFRGYGVFVSKKTADYPASLVFAHLLGSAMRQNGFVFSPHHSEPIAQENRPILDPVDGIYQYDDLIVLKTALMPAALLECGVIVNRTEEAALSSPAAQQKIVDAAATAIERFLAR